MGARANYETMNVRARRKLLETTNTPAQLNRIYIRDGGICQLCKKPCKRKDASRDHIKDLVKCTKEEARSDDNLQLAHIWCNINKHRVPRQRLALTYTIGERFPELNKLTREPD